MTIGYWSTAVIFAATTFFFLVYLGDFWTACLVFFLLFLPLSFYLFMPVAVVGGILGGIIGWVVKKLRRSCHDS